MIVAHKTISGATAAYCVDSETSKKGLDVDGLHEFSSNNHVYRATGESGMKVRSEDYSDILALMMV